jgi:hypothetical protein
MIFDTRFGTDIPPPRHYSKTKAAGADAGG